MNTITKQIVGEAIVNWSNAVVLQMSNTIDQVVADTAPHKLPPTPAQVQAVVVKMTTQTPLLKSKRVWATALPVAATLGYALLDPSLIAAFVAWLGAHPGAWWGVAAQLVAVALPILSKAMDPRPTR